MRKTFIFYNDRIDYTLEMTIEEKGILFQTILEYQNGLPITYDNSVIRVLFPRIKKQLDEDNKKRDNEKKLKSEAGKKGMKTRWGKGNTNNITNNNTVITNDNNVKKNITEITVNVNDNVNGSLGGSIQNLPKDKKREVGVASGGPAGGVGSRQGKKFGSLANEFELLAKKYPGSRPKHLAINEYNVARNKHTFDDIRKGIEMYSEYVSINGVDDKYIKGMKNFLAEEVYLEYKDMESKLVPGTKEHYKRFCKNMVGKEYESLLGFGKQKYSDQGYKRYLMIEYGMDEHTAVKLENQCNGSDEYFKSLLK